MDKVNNYLCYIPGFKSNQLWKKIISLMVYSVMILFTLIFKIFIPLTICLFIAILLIGFLRVQIEDVNILIRSLIYSSIFVVLFFVGIVITVVNVGKNSIDKNELIGTEVQVEENLVESEDELSDEELGALLNQMNKTAGNNSLAVSENLSEDGKEIIGIWKSKVDESSKREYTLERFKFYTDGQNEETVLEGTWTFDYNTKELTHKLDKVIVNGIDKTSEIENDIVYLIVGFNEDEMKIFVPDALQERTYIRDNE